VFFVLVGAVLWPSFWCYGLRTPFESLPANTFGAVRIVNSEVMREDLRENTKIGRLLLSPERIAAYKAYISDLADSDEKFGAFVKDLEAAGLTLEDVYGILSSEFGGALSLREVEGYKSLPMLYLWAEMKPGMAEKVFESVLESSADSDSVKRENQQIAGLDTARVRSAKDGSSALMTRLENRFLFVIGFPVEGVYSKELGEAYEEAELQALGSFIEAQRGAGGGFLDNFYEEGEIIQLRPERRINFEVLCDLQKVLGFFLEEDEKSKIDQFGMSQFTKLAAWSAYEGKVASSKLFIGAPALRSGIAALIDQDSFDFQPPVWVPADLNAYTTVSIDLPRMYEVILKFAVGSLPPGMLEQQQQRVDDQLNQFLQTDLETILSSFGNRVHVVEYPSELVDVTYPPLPSWAEGEGNEIGEDDGGEVELEEITMQVPQESLGLIIDFKNPEILAKAVEFISQFAGDPASGIEIFEEQGFHGVRIEKGGISMVFSYGLGKLVFARGTDTASKVFSFLNNPPAAEDALVNDGQFREFMDRVSPKEGSAFSYADGDKLIQDVISAWAWLQQSSFQNGRSDVPAELKELLEILPKKEEFEDAMGAIFTRTYSNQDGLVVEGINEFK
jgi:hypothetical protein